MDAEGRERIHLAVSLLASVKKSLEYHIANGAMERDDILRRERIRAGH